MALRFLRAKNTATQQAVEFVEVRENRFAVVDSVKVREWRKGKLTRSEVEALAELPVLLTWPQIRDGVAAMPSWTLGSDADTNRQREKMNRQEARARKAQQAGRR